MVTHFDSNKFPSLAYLIRARSIFYKFVHRYPSWLESSPLIHSTFTGAASFKIRI